MTVSKAVDCLIAAWCIVRGVKLLHADSNFAPFAEHCGLRVYGSLSRIGYRMANPGPDAFAPYETLAARLLPALPDGDDAAHDLAHLRRVFGNAFAIQATEGGDGRTLAAAVLLHDCVAVAKSSPLRAQASRLSAARAGELLAELDWKAPDIAAVAHAIEAHSFSAGIPPRSIEARILQDADRLDAIGAIGIARCFYTGGRMGSALYDADDPGAARRALDDRRFALDHFAAKLLTLAEGFQTPTGAIMARRRHEHVAAFHAAFLEEIGKA